MSDPRAVPEGEVRERLGLTRPAWMVKRATEIPDHPVSRALFASAGLRWDGTAYREIEGRQE